VSCKAQCMYFDEDGALIETSSFFVPDYLDWMPIAPKIEWFLIRGYGPPHATHTLFQSQGEVRLLSVNQSLSYLKHDELKERENGIKERIDQYITENGISRAPRNQ